MINERYISDNVREPEPIILTLDSRLARDDIETEILDGHASSSEPLDCPISILSAGWSRTRPPTIAQSPTTTEANKLDNPPDSNETSQKSAALDLSIYKIIASSDENTAVQEFTDHKNNTGNECKLHRSGRNVDPPQFYGKKLFIDIIN